MQFLHTGAGSLIDTDTGSLTDTGTGYGPSTDTDCGPVIDTGYGPDTCCGPATDTGCGPVSDLSVTCQCHRADTGEHWEHWVPPLLRPVLRVTVMLWPELVRRLGTACKPH